MSQNKGVNGGTFVRLLRIGDLFVDERRDFAVRCSSDYKYGRKRRKFLVRTNYDKGASYHVIKPDDDDIWTAGLGVVFYIGKC